MKPIILNKNSWHYKLANFPNQNRKTEDICSYTKSILAGLFPFSILVFFAVIATVSVGDFSAWLVSGIFYGFGEIHPESVPALLVLITTFGFFLFFLIERMREKIPGVSEENVIVQAYRSWKDKYCVKLEFKG